MSSSTTICLPIWVAFGYVLGGCRNAEEITANIVDAANRPISGAILYVEAYDRKGTFDFAFAGSGAAGEVPASGQPTLRIRWRAGAKLAFAVFAEGKKPVVVYDQLGRIQPRGNVFELADLPEVGWRWESRIAELAFPFEDDPVLAGRAAAAHCVGLRQAFREAYRPLIDGEESVLPEEQAKIEALDRLEGLTSPKGG